MTTQVAKITFDGGTRPTNPGNGYGSWHIEVDGKYFGSMSEMEYGENLTNNQAEYLTLNEALSWFTVAHGSPQFVSLEIWSDSKLVVEQLKSSWRCKHARMKTLRDIILERLDAFGLWTIHWHSRVESVALFGH